MPTLAHTRLRTAIRDRQSACANTLAKEHRPKPWKHAARFSVPVVTIRAARISSGVPAPFSSRSRTTMGKRKHSFGWHTPFFKAVKGSQLYKQPRKPYDCGPRLRISLALRKYMLLWGFLRP